MSDLNVIKIKFDSLRPLMNERLRRLWAAAEARGIGWGGINRVAAATGLSHKTIATGLRELNDLAQPADGSVHIPESQERPGGRQALDRVRRRGGGNKRIEIKDPAILSALSQLLVEEVAGDPMSEQKWVRSSLRSLSERLTAQGHPISSGAVARLLKGLGFSLKANKKKQGASGRCPERDEQFRYITAQRQVFAAKGLPIMSVDTKKKELIGNFRNPGHVWCKEAPEVDEHDFPSSAECRAVPFGVYDVVKNTGHVVVGMSHNTPEFAVNAIERWWLAEGRLVYPGTGELLILADGGGGNGSRAKAWKVNLQEKLCNRHRLTVTVCHYPPGCSKWNPIEHRLFSQISRNWAGKPLRTLGIMLGYIRGTTTTTGLRVKAVLDENTYRKGQKITREDFAKVSLKPHPVCSTWNYTISPVEDSHRV
jgi:hypothetical protein